VNEIDGVKIVPGFVHRPGHHCATSAMAAGLRTVGVDLAEEVLLGLAQGLGGAYFDFKFMLPFLAGRSGGRKGVFEMRILEALKIPGESLSSLSARKVSAWAREELESGRAAVVYVDMAYLPYHDFPPGEHFGGHLIAVIGYDEGRDRYAVADRFAAPVSLSGKDFIKARTSKHPPFPAIGTQVFIRPPDQSSIDLIGATRAAIHANMETFHNPPIANVGVNAAAKFADQIVRWPGKFPTDKLAAALNNIHLFIELGGTGGAAFRRMYSRFLDFTAQITGEGRYRIAAEKLAVVAEDWTRMAELCLQDGETVAGGGNPSHLMQIAELAKGICVAEKELFKPLLDL